MLLCGIDKKCDSGFLKRGPCINTKIEKLCNLLGHVIARTNRDSSKITVANWYCFRKRQKSVVPKFVPSIKLLLTRYITTCIFTSDGYRSAFGFELRDISNRFELRLINRSSGHLFFFFEGNATLGTCGHRGNLYIRACLVLTMDQREPSRSSTVVPTVIQWYLLQEALMSCMVVIPCLSHVNRSNR